MATLVKTAGGWKAVVRKLGFPTTAKTFRSKRDAEDWSRGIEDAMVRGVYVERTESGRMLIGAALDRYLVEVTPGKKASTQRSDQVKAKPLRQSLGKYAIGALKPEHVARYRDERLAAGKSTSTVRLELALLGHLYTTAIREWGLGLARNPVIHVRKPSTLESARRRRLVDDEETRLLTACRQHSNPMLAWIVELSIHTAMRQGEILGLHVGDVDLARRIVSLHDTKNAESRTVPLSQRATTVLQEALANPLRPKGCDLVFFGEAGADGRRRPYVIAKLWRAACERAAIEGLRFHDLRHEAASRLVEKGLSDQQVAAITGHKSMQMLKRYSHLRAEDLVALLD